MTCIVGIRHKGLVYMGADSAGVSGWDITARADSKVFLNGPYLIGFTTSFRMGQLLKYSLKTEEPDLKNLERFMNTKFIDAVRKTLADGGFKKTTDGVEKGGSFLVAINERLFIIDSDFQVGESIEPFSAVGCGSSYALGSLFTTKYAKDFPAFRIQKALEAAAKFSAGVCEPFITLDTGV